ncbi:hypothetical protein [Pedobacter sandarakinus]|uniref:hypothetical protein n=1 Tax=Pedobacter sandarakinus TaxID=353156 RepID=UPI002247E64B|nr:hypothetical protein [Pedobacter sandarakinus]MCX2573421.1 hypothetical protein [Pedobacter sandarakinus]
MALAYINLSAKQYFNFMCTTAFERRIFHDSYSAFQLQAQRYVKTPSTHTFEHMLTTNPGAASLHQQLNTAVANTINGLKNKAPIICNTDNEPLFFDVADFEIHSSDLLNKAAHVVAITYTTPILVLHDIVGDCLVLSYQAENTIDHTFMVNFNQELKIKRYRNLSLTY